MLGPLQLSCAGGKKTSVACSGHRAGAKSGEEDWSMGEETVLAALCWDPSCAPTGQPSFSSTAGIFSVGQAWGTLMGGTREGVKEE